MALNIVQGGNSRVKGIAGGTITSGDMLQWSAGTLIAATDGTSCAGVAIKDYSSGETVVAIKGDGATVIRISAASGVDFGMGDKCYVYTATSVDAGSQNNLACGIVVNTDPSEAGNIDMELWTPATTGQYFAHA